MNISAILVVIAPGKLEPTLAHLQDMPNLEVHHIDEETHRLILTQEAETIDAEIKGLKAIKKVPGIVMAEMVQHYFGEDTHDYPADMAAECNDAEAVHVPGFLNQ